MSSKLDALRAKKKDLEISLSESVGIDRDSLLAQINEVDISIVSEKIADFSLKLEKAIERQDHESIEKYRDGLDAFKKDREELIEKRESLISPDLAEDVKDIAESEDLEIPRAGFEGSKETVKSWIEENSPPPIPEIAPTSEIQAMSEKIAREHKLECKSKNIDEAIKFLRENESRIQQKFEVDQSKIKNYESKKNDYEKAAGEQRGISTKPGGMDPGPMWDRSIKAQELKVEMLDAKLAATADKGGRERILEEMQTEARRLRDYQGQKRVYDLSWNSDGSKRTDTTSLKWNADGSTKTVDIQEPLKKSDAEEEEKVKKPSGGEDRVTASAVSQAKHVIHQADSPILKLMHRGEIKDAVKTITDSKIESFEKSKKLKDESVQLSPSDRKSLEKLVKRETEGLSKIEKIEACSSFYKTVMKNDYIKEYNAAAEKVSHSQVAQKNLLERSIRENMVLVQVKESVTIVDSGSPDKLEKVAKEKEQKAGCQYQVMSKFDAEKIGAKASSPSPEKKEEAQKETASRAKVRA
ncbi:MAG: hypothetical protein ACYCT9_00495 [Leptospirillum sp.]|jgi:hypothetical protein